MGQVTGRLYALSCRSLDRAMVSATPDRLRSARPPMSPPTARQKAAESDIFKLDSTDICTLGL
jgi:hypothetical protein